MHSVVVNVVRYIVIVAAVAGNAQASDLGPNAPVLPSLGSQDWSVSFSAADSLSSCVSEDPVIVGIGHRVTLNMDADDQQVLSIEVGSQEKVGFGASLGYSIEF